MRKQRNMTGKWAQKWEAQIEQYWNTHPDVRQQLTDYMKGSGYTGKPKDTFHATVRGFVKQGMSVDKAIKKTLRTSAFMSHADILHENAIKGLRGFKDAYDVWRKFTRHQRIDKNKLTYIGNNTYEYDFDKNWTIYIEYTNSPTEAKVWRKHK